MKKLLSSKFEVWIVSIELSIMRGEIYWMHTWVKENLQIRAPLISSAYSQRFFNRTESVDCNIEMGFGFYSFFHFSLLFLFLFVVSFIHSFGGFSNSVPSDISLSFWYTYISQHKSEFKNRLYNQPFNSDGMSHISIGFNKIKQFC